MLDNVLAVFIIIFFRGGTLKMGKVRQKRHRAHQGAVKANKEELLEDTSRSSLGTSKVYSKSYFTVPI